MTIRYAVQGSVSRSLSGPYVSFAEHEELLKEILEDAAEHCRRVQRGELTADQADRALRVLAKLLTS